MAMKLMPILTGIMLSALVLCGCAANEQLAEPLEIETKEDVAWYAPKEEKSEHFRVLNLDGVGENDDEAILTADVNDLDNENYRYEDYYCGNTAKRARNRTFFGHKSDGSFLMVCTKNAKMDLIAGAKMMVDLGCDFAVNEDGASAMKMRVATGYSGTETPGQVTVGGTDYYGAAICAYKK